MEDKKPASANTTSQHGSRPSHSDKAGGAKKGDDPMAAPTEDSPPRNPESAPGGDQVGGDPEQASMTGVPKPGPDDKKSEKK